MLKENSRYPKFFIYMLMALSAMNLISAFINIYVAAATFFISIIVLVVFMILDKRFGGEISNYKLTFFLLDLICVISLVIILVYESKNATIVLNVFMALVIGVIVLSMIIDWFLIKNQNFTNNENTLVNVIKLCSMICILTYFFNISDLFFALDAFIFEFASVVLKIYLNAHDDEKKKEEVEKEPTIEERIFSAGESEGDMD